MPSPKFSSKAFFCLVVGFEIVGVAFAVFLTAGALFSVGFLAISTRLMVYFTQLLQNLIYTMNSVLMVATTDLTVDIYEVKDRDI